ncbi:hypothetical protein CWI39_0637p0030 [Hamiltosporidium magnivora]|uniref:Uncharacterized protein n=1 Tax=Hamiltosporidium magnivora TaxID=148818 RepID=A0A4Q9LCV4_9MICR|nr:hypothetical protein CWI39_0637p0030 [Hamiltosporidium magnivora]TBU07737.1 hypothetical protein CWI36_0234p0060 [Hamiltosporidium magnivora]
MLKFIFYCSIILNLFVFARVDIEENPRRSTPRDPKTEDPKEDTTNAGSAPKSSSKNPDINKVLELIGMVGGENTAKLRLLKKVNIDTFLLKSEGTKEVSDDAIEFDLTDELKEVSSLDKNNTFEIEFNKNKLPESSESPKLYFFELKETNGQTHESGRFYFDVKDRKYKLLPKQADPSWFSRYKTVIFTVLGVLIIAVLVFAVLKFLTK